MTQYFDKYGTEIRDGDRFLDGLRKEIVFGQWESWLDVERCAMYAIVLSRADGSLVHRYCDNQDVRAGDLVEHNAVTGSIGPVNHKDFVWFQSGQASCWTLASRCTLIHRSETAKTETDGSVTITKANGEATRYQFGQETPMDRARQWAAENRAIKPMSEAESAAFSQHCSEQLAKLNQPLGTSKPVPDAGDAFVALLRALNQPTLSQRFAAFKSRVTRVLGPYPRVTVRFDCGQTTGPTAILWCDAVALERPVVIREETSDAHIGYTLLEWAQVLGRAEMEKQWAK